MILSFELRWNTQVSSCALILSISSHKSLCNHCLMRISSIKSSLLHHTIKCGVVFLSKFNWRWWNFWIDNSRKQVNVSSSILSNSLNESSIFGWIKMVLQVGYLNLNFVWLFICDFLQNSHIFEFSVNWVLICSWNCWILECRYKLRDFAY